MTNPSIAVLTPLSTRFDDITVIQLKHYLKGIELQNYPNLTFIFTCHSHLTAYYQRFFKEHLSYPFSIISLEPLEIDPNDLLLKIKDLAFHRNNLLEHARKYDYGFFLDSDVELPPNTLTRFVKLNVDIVGGITIVPVATHHGANTDKTLTLSWNFGEFLWSSNNLGFDLPIQPPNRPATVDFISTACLFISNRVLNHPSLDFNLIFDGIVPLSEDLSYCYKAQKLGFKVWLHPKVLTIHHRAMHNAILSLDASVFVKNENKPLTLPLKMYGYTVGTFKLNEMRQVNERQSTSVKDTLTCINQVRELLLLKQQLQALVDSKKNHVP